MISILINAVNNLDELRLKICIEVKCQNITPPKKKKAKMQLKFCEKRHK